MIVLLKKGLTYKAGDLFPIISIPVYSQGEKQELKDFQWWCPTKEWNEWLKKNPRSWTAESIEFSEGDYNSLYEIFGSSKLIDPKVLSFGEFKSLLEAEDKSVKVDGQGEASDKQKKNFTKFLFAYNKLKESGKLNNQIEISKLQEGSEYAIVTELPDDSGVGVYTTRNAIRSKVVSDLGSSILVSMTESIPFGKFEEGSNSGNAFFQIAKFGAQLVSSGVGFLAVGAGAIYASKAIWKRFAAKKATEEVLKGGSKWYSRFFSKGAETAVEGAAERTAARTATQQAARQTITELGGEYIATESGLLVPASTEIGVGTSAATATAAGAETGAAGAAAGISGATVAGIAAAVLVVASAVQRIINWTSDAQAPTYGDLEGKVGVSDNFKPGSIPDGQVITVCWTQDSGNSWFTNILWDEDTRTTMDIIKLGNFEGKAVFMLIQINSKAYNELMKKNEIILLKFDEQEVFDTSWYDNDDLEFELVAIPKGDQNLAVNTIFQGYSLWEEMENAYKNSDDSFLGVPENAPDEYSFHYKLGKSGRIVNVTGSLVKDIESATDLKGVFSEEKKSSNESLNFYRDLDFQKLLEGTEVLSFSEFSNSLVKKETLLEADGEDNEKQKEDQQFLTQTQKIAAYQVSSISYADPAYDGQDLPNLETFIVPNEYLEAKDQSDILVQPVQDVSISGAKKGTIVIETEEAPKDEPFTGATGGEIEGAGIPIEVTKGEIKVKYQDNPDFLNALGIPDVNKIKDKEEEDLITIISVIKPEEKEELGMNNWDFIKKVKIYKDGKSGEPYMIRFTGESQEGKEKLKIKASDANFDTALKVADRIQSGFKQVDKDEKEEK